MREAESGSKVPSVLQSLTKAGCFRGSGEGYCLGNNHPPVVSIGIYLGAEL